MLIPFNKKMQKIPTFDTKNSNDDDNNNNNSNKIMIIVVIIENIK